MPDRILLGPDDDQRDAAQRAVAALAGGGRVGITLDGTRGVLVSALVRPSGERTSAPAASPPPTLLLPNPAAWADWVEPITVVARKLATRAWPGAVRLAAVPSPSGLFGRLDSGMQDQLRAADGRVAFQVTDDPVVRAILGLSAGPVLLHDAPANAWADADSPDLPALILETESPPAAGPATVVRLDGEGWAVARPGVVSESTLRELAGTILLFVCTGNTCRSPMAAAYCRLIMARRLGCTVADLPARGFTVESAGVAASTGSPASTHAVTVLRQMSLDLGLGPSDSDLSQHRSRPTTANLVRRADRIFAMTWDHLDALVDQFPEVVDRVRLLDPDGFDIPDPYGSDETTYRDTVESMARGLNAILSELGFRATTV